MICIHTDSYIHFQSFSFIDPFFTSFLKHIHCAKIMCSHPPLFCQLLRLTWTFVVCRHRYEQRALRWSKDWALSRTSHSQILPGILRNHSNELCWFLITCLTLYTYVSWGETWKCLAKELCRTGAASAGARVFSPGGVYTVILLHSCGMPICRPWRFLSAVS